MATPPVVVLQSQQPFPRGDGPFVDESGFITDPWYRLLVSLWRKLGAQALDLTNAVYFTFDGSTVSIWSVTTNTLQGTIPFQTAVGGPAQAQAPLTSPFVFIPASPGTAIVSSAQVEFSRDGGATYYLVTLQGGAVPMLLGDRIRVTWYGATLPIVTFMPSVIT